MTNTTLVKISELEKFLANITNIGDARKLLALAEGLVTVARKEYKAAEKISETIEDRDRAYHTAVKAGELRLMAEGRLGELIKQEQEAGRLAGRGGDQSSISGTLHLRDYGLTKQDSSRAQKILEHQDLIPEVVAKAIQRNDLPTRRAFERIVMDLKRQDELEQNKKLVESTSPLPVDKYRTILLDPPWDWGDEHDESQLGRARPIYSTISFDDLLELPIPTLAEDDAHIYLWITNRSLPKGFPLLQKWGFRYITLITWCKPTFGMGNYFRGQTEHIMFGVKGNCPLLRHDVGTCFAAERGDRHSSKPEYIYELIESCSPGPWLELFARSERKGWRAWGAELQL